MVNDALPSGAIVGATIHFTYDATQLGTLSAADLTYAPDWSLTGGNFTAGDFKAILSNISNDGQTKTGEIVSIKLHPTAAPGKLKSYPVTVKADSDTTDFDYNTVKIGTDIAASVLPGTTTDLGGIISGSVSVGLGANDAKVVAAVVNTGTAINLRLLNAQTLADIGTGTLTAPTGGRPAFGYIGGSPVVAVGEDDGNLAIFNATDASAVGAPIQLGNKVATPAIDSTTGNIYAVAATSGGAPKLHLVKSGASAQSVDLDGTTVGAAPAFVAGGVAAGSDTKLFLFRTDGSGPFVPQATITGAGITSPVVFGDGRGLVAAADGTVYQFDLTTGTVAANTVAAATGAAPFSEGFPVAGGAIYGGTDGAVYQFTLGASGPAAGTKTALLSTPILSEPIALGSTIYAIDNTGVLKSSDGTADLSLGGPATGALAATGTAAGTDSIIAASTNGTVASLPF